MKLILILCLLISTHAFGICTIAFENELAANRNHQALYEEVLEFKHILLGKGYRLKSVNDGEPHFDAFIFGKETGGGYSLMFHSNSSPTIKMFETTYEDDDLATQDLFRKLPSCRLVK